MSKPHTCINTATTIDGSGPPPCAACAELPRCSHGMLASLGHCDVCTERSAIVGWMRTFDVEKGIDYLADAIEAGEHLEPVLSNKCPTCGGGDIDAAKRLPPGTWTCLGCGVVWRTKTVTPKRQETE